MLHHTNNPNRIYQRAEEQREIGADDPTPDLAIWQLLEGAGSDVERLDAVAALLHAFAYLHEHDVSWVRNDRGDDEESFFDIAGFAAAVNDLLLGDRVDWHYDGRSFDQRGNHVLHAVLVRPATFLLEERPEFATTSAAYQAALTRLSNNQPTVAITDAATALQEFFRALGADGESISDQLNRAATMKLITAYDRKLLHPILGWVNADRSNRGNAHHHRDEDVSKADAWLQIHVVGALMVRLSNEEPRDIEAARNRRYANDAKSIRKAADAAMADPELRRVARELVWNDEVPF